MLPVLLTLLLQLLLLLLPVQLLDLLLDLLVLQGRRGRRELCRAGRQLQQRVHLGRKRGRHTRRRRLSVITTCHRSTLLPPHSCCVWGMKCGI